MQQQQSTPALLRVEDLHKWYTLGGGWFGKPAQNVKAVYEKDWVADRWAIGCPGGVLPPGTLLDFGQALTAPVGKIHWAGTETSDYWAGYMDGAVRSGERSAAEVLAAL